MPATSEKPDHIWLPSPGILSENFSPGVLSENPSPGILSENFSPGILTNLTNAVFHITLKNSLIQGVYGIPDCAEATGK